ncbi:MAG: DegV family protein [Clostridiaceae bacterium]|nr:DegV family protein [Clostridiaceae bacterium]
MEKIHIFSDSACDIPEELVKSNGIEIIPVHITHEGRTFREYYDTTPEQYWKLLKESQDIPQTSQITPAQVLECYRGAHARGCTHVLGMTMSAKGSGGYQSCLIARDLFYEEYGDAMRIEVVDSETYTMIYGRILLKAARLRSQGDSFDAILGVVRSRVSRSEAVLGVYTLRHLKKSGRISGGAAFVGEALGLKPISHVCAGTVDVCGKVRGEKNLIPKMLDFVQSHAAGIEHQTAGLLHGAVPEDKLSELERGLYGLGFRKVERWPIGVSVITNTGPEALAVMYYGEPREG